MPKKAEFEEREYETFVNLSLARESNFVFTPGLRLEGYLSFDAAIPLRDGKIFALLGVRRKGRRLQGVKLRRLPLEGRIGRILGRMPDVRFSLFLQYKRPELVVGHRAREWSHWRTEYFRYSIEREQAKCLRRLERSLGSKAIVRYAAPSFLARKALWDFALSNEVVRQSNFASASKLASHSVYTFSSAGSNGAAFSEPTPVDEESLFDAMVRKRDQEPDERATHLGWIGKAIHTSMNLATQEDEDDDDDESEDGEFDHLRTARRAYHNICRDFDIGEPMVPTKTPLFDAFVRIYAFRLVMGTSITTVSNPGD